MRRALFIFLLVLTSQVVPIPGLRASDAPPPSAWPNTELVRPRLEALSHSLRFYGDNRYQTALAATLLLRGSGEADSYPYGNPDPAAPQGWWGLNTCPRSIIIVAGDNPADALAANTLSDPTGGSTEPYLQRSAAADPLFFPPGGFARVDTDFAPVLTTTSARDGATQLDLATRLAAQDLSRGACTTAKQAIIVGGVRAIANSVESELVSIGYDEVFRVAGISRYHTARLVAEALGTAVASGSPTRTACVDSSSRGGARPVFYANSVIEYRESIDQCRVLSRAVVLADGVDGIDALASGWWTSFWQVPILLTSGTSTLPVPTRDALQTLDIDTLVILGGESRIPQSVIDYAVDLSGADTVIRVAGSDRYETSIEMARRFGGWWGTNRFADAQGSALCVAASSGGSGGRGWPDALAAGPWCARAAVARSSLGAPVRSLSPIAGGSGGSTDDSATNGEATHLFVPMVLVPAGSDTLPTPVETALREVFPDQADICSGSQADAGCLAPGFVYVAGGRSVVSPGAVTALARIVSGGNAQDDQAEPALDAPFATSLDLSPVFGRPEGADPSDQVICLTRDSYRAARWLIVEASEQVKLDLVDEQAYGHDADGEVRTPGRGAPLCLAPDLGTDQRARVRVVGPAGQPTENGLVRTLDFDPNRRFSMSASLAAANPTTASGVDSLDGASAGGTTTWTFVDESPTVSVTSRGTTTAITRAEITISLLRGQDRGTTAGVDSFEATFRFETALGSVRGTIEGEALRSTTGWQLRGRSDFDPGSWNVDSGLGGFTADLTVAGTGLVDDSILWRVDGQI